MNKIQSMFKIEERGHRNRKQEILVAILYASLSLRQARYLRRWRESITQGRTPIDDKAPWLTYTCVDFLQNILRSDMTIFEYGSGGSTMYFADRVEKVVSVEHDDEWFSKVQGCLQKQGVSNVDYRLCKPIKKSVGALKHEYFRSSKETSVSFKDYVLAIDEFPDNHFDVVVVDGRSRVPCLREAYAKVKDSGYLILDNSERKDYHEAFLFMRKKYHFEKNFFGIIGYTTSLMQTTIWKVKKT